MGEQQIVSPQEAAVWASPGWRSPINAAFAEQLLHTVATEPERIAAAERAAVVKALRKSSSNPWLGPATQRSLRAQADAIENGADL